LDHILIFLPDGVSYYDECVRYIESVHVTEFGVAIDKRVGSGGSLIPVEDAEARRCIAREIRKVVAKNRRLNLLPRR
jgi:hypothetical protein